MKNCDGFVRRHVGFNAPTNEDCEGSSGRLRDGGGRVEAAATCRDSILDNLPDWAVPEVSVGFFVELGFGPFFLSVCSCFVGLFRFYVVGASARFLFRLWAFNII